MPTPPTNNLGKWRSVELECVFKGVNDFHQFNDWHRTKLSSQERDFVEIKGDSSIEAAYTIDGVQVQDYGVPREVVVTYCAGKEGEKFLTKVCKKLNDLAIVNAS